MVTPPHDALALESFTGEAQVAALPGVVGIVRRLADGQHVDASQGDVANAALVYIRGETHDGVLGVLEQVEQTWSVHWRQPTEVD